VTAPGPAAAPPKAGQGSTSPCLGGARIDWLQTMEGSPAPPLYHCWTFFPSTVRPNWLSVGVWVHCRLRFGRLAPRFVLEPTVTARHDRSERPLRLTSLSLRLCHSVSTGDVADPILREARRRSVVSPAGTDFHEIHASMDGRLGRWQRANAAERASGMEAPGDVRTRP
jgi:hypothetical protein